MTKQEAKQAMISGEKITHDLFVDGEYVYINEHGQMLDENKTDVGPSFWKLRENNPRFDAGWSIYKCKHEFVSREYTSQPYGHCESCGKTIINQ